MGHKMKFIHLKSGFVVVEYRGEQTIIHDRVLAQEMNIRGIVVPSALRQKYGGKASIRINDPEFQRAFQEDYTPQVYHPNHYGWKE
jgi:hypothetical protein